MQRATEGDRPGGEIAAAVALVAVSPSVTAPPAVEAVRSALPVTERTPALVNVVEPPSGATPPPPRPVPAMTVMASTGPDKLAAVVAKIAYGTGVNCWRGVRALNVAAPLVFTPICSQLL
jgi:hypothetical protein